MTNALKGMGLACDTFVESYCNIGDIRMTQKWYVTTSNNKKLEDLMVLKRSPDLLNNVKIGQDQLQHIMKHILFYGGCGHFGQVT